MKKVYQVANKRVMFSQEMDPNIFKKDLPPGFTLLRTVIKLAYF